MSAYLAVCGTRKVTVLSDTAHYDERGVLNGLRSKCVVLGRAVLVNRGKSGTIARILLGMKGDKTSFDSIVTGFSEAALKYVETSFHHEHYGAKDSKGFDVLLAGWSDKQNSPLAFRWLNKRVARDERRSPYQLHQLQIAVGIQMRSAALHGRAFAAALRNAGGPNHFDGIAHGLPLFNAARMNPVTLGRPIVGGVLERVEIDQDGVRMSQIHSWPDKVGDPIHV